MFFSSQSYTNVFFRLKSFFRLKEENLRTESDCSLSFDSNYFTF